jgi:hypothetical protein
MVVACLMLVIMGAVTLIAIFSLLDELIRWTKSEREWKRGIKKYNEQMKGNK